MRGPAGCPGSTLRAARRYHTTAVLTCLLAILTSSPALAAPPNPRPNILFIFTDDQSHRTVRCYEESPTWVTTPNIDRLAAEGVRFRHAYAGTWCVPSRAMFLTGLQPHAIQGMHFENNPVSTYDPAVCRFWPASLRKAGYTTAFIGKWHLSPDAGHGRDWDHSVVWFHSIPKAAGGYYTDQKLSFDGGPLTPVGGYSTDNYTRYAADFLKRPHDRPWFLWLCYGATHGPYTPAPRHQDRYQNDPVPTPVDIFPPRPDKPRYARDFGVWQRGPVARPEGRVARPESAKGVGPADEPVLEGRTLADWVRLYNRGVLAIDEGVGQLVKTLEQTGQLDNTFIVFASDQGFAWGQHGFRHKVAPYDSNLRAPFIIRPPGRVSTDRTTPSRGRVARPESAKSVADRVARPESATGVGAPSRASTDRIAPRGKVCSHPVATLDLVPTFFALAQTPPPWPMHGHDLAPLLRDPTAPWPHPLLLEYFRWEFGHETDHARTTAPANFQGIPWWLSLRQDRYKYVRTLLDDEIEELYDLHSDPDELHNLAVHAKHHPLLTDFRSRLTAELHRTGAPLVKNLPSPKIISK